MATTDDQVEVRDIAGGVRDLLRGTGAASQSKWVRGLRQGRESNVFFAVALHAAERRTHGHRLSELEQSLLDLMGVVMTADEVAAADAEYGAAKRELGELPVLPKDRARRPFHQPPFICTPARTVHVVLERLAVVANSTLVVRGDDLVLPYQAVPGEEKTADVAVRSTAAARAVPDLAAAPIRFADLRDKLVADFPVDADRATRMLRELVARRVLVSSLHAPATVPDLIGHVIAELRGRGHLGPVEDGGLSAALWDVHERMTGHHRLPGRRQRGDLAARMRVVHAGEGHPLALDVRLDAELTLPDAVVSEVERAAGLLARLSARPRGNAAMRRCGDAAMRRCGDAAWRDYHRRFFERYGIGAPVPVQDMVAGIGWPDGYPGAEAPAEPPLSPRDRTLLGLAQRAAAAGQSEVEVTHALLDSRIAASLGEAGSVGFRPPPHLELVVRVHAATEQLVQRGRFLVEVRSATRGAGVLSGRFHDLLGIDAAVGLWSARLLGVAVRAGPDGGPGPRGVVVRFSPQVRPRLWFRSWRPCRTCRPG